MNEPLQAVVKNGLVTDVVVCDQATADMFALYFPNLFPGSLWYDVTSTRVSVLWTYADARVPQFRGPFPGEGWEWSAAVGDWVLPADPEPVNPVTPDPQDEP